MKLVSFFVILVTLNLLNCATQGQSPSRIRQGMDKDEVLNVAGNPKRTFRATGQDHWIYVEFVNSKEIQRQISFEDGRVVKIAKPTAAHQLVKELEDAKPVLKKNNDSGFKDIDGGS